MKFLALLLSLTTGCFATASEPVTLELVSDLPAVRAAADEWSEVLADLTRGWGVEIWNPVRCKRILPVPR